MKCTAHTDCRIIYHPAKYEPIPADRVPSHLTWDSDPEDRGQIVLVEYGDFGRGAPGEGSLYRGILDQSRTNAKMEFAKRTKEGWWEHRAAIALATGQK